MTRVSKSRVLWLIKGLGPGGAERLLAAAATVRDSNRFEYEVAYLLPWKDAFVPAFAEAGVPVHCLDVQNEWNVLWARRLRRLLEERPFDIVHVHSPYVATVTRGVVRTMRKSARPRLVTTEHNGWPTYSRWTRLLNSSTSRFDDATIAISEHVADSMRGPARRRVEVVVHGVVLDDVRHQLAERGRVREELGFHPDELVVGTVANYLPQKDYPNFFAAARKVAERDPRVRFCAVGQGPLASEIAAMHRDSGLGDRFVLTGFRPDAVRVMAGYDLFVLASRFEGLSVALMEALALGLPIVATLVGGIPQAVHHGVEGLLVPPEDPGALAAAIEKLADDPALRERMGAAGVARSEEFDIGRAVRQIERIYERVLAP